MKILLVSATPFEIAPLINYLETNWTKKSFFEFSKENNSIMTLVTGIGSVNTAFGLSRFNGMEQIDIVFNVGIAGALNTTIPIGSVVEVIKDKFGDIGVEEADGNFSDLFDLEWESPNNYPYTDGWLLSSKSKFDCGLIKVSGITVNKVHGYASSISKIKDKYPTAHLESMEGAAFAMSCLLNDVKYHQIRSVSNIVEPRNKEGWQIETAITNLNQKLIGIIESISIDKI